MGVVVLMCFPPPSTWQAYGMSNRRRHRKDHFGFPDRGNGYPAAYTPLPERMSGIIERLLEIPAGPEGAIQSTILDGFAEVFG